MFLSPSWVPPNRRGRCCRCPFQMGVRCTAWCQLCPQTPSRSFLSRWRLSGSQRWNVCSISRKANQKTNWWTRQNKWRDFLQRLVKDVKQYILCYASWPFDLIELSEDRVDHSDGIRRLCSCLACIPSCCQTLHLNKTQKGHKRNSLLSKHFSCTIISDGCFCLILVFSLYFKTNSRSLKNFYLINQDKHKSIFVINQLLDLLKHLCDQLTALQQRSIRSYQNNPSYIKKLFWLISSCIKGAARCTSENHFENKLWLFISTNCPYEYLQAEEWMLKRKKQVQFLLK